LIDDFNLFISDKKLGLNGYNSFKNYSRIFLNGKKIIKSKINLNGDKLILYKLQ